MLASSLILGLLGPISLVAALPTAGFKPSLEKRQPGGILITTEINWGGTTGYAKQPFDLCIQLSSPWYHTISSFGPDSGNAAVFSESVQMLPFYPKHVADGQSRDNSCAGNSYTMLYPGSIFKQADLRNQDWNDRIGSFRVREVSVVNGQQCIQSVDNNRLPGLNCQFCCNGCNRSGTGCCPDGAIC
ncbi:hypothetical protein BDD12DRAFT_803367 [Trichophaea hybrida]|nr:hypothetical protein BDD12DRAFT_803367 [Trichophaea hybrida]